MIFTIEQNAYVPGWGIFKDGSKKIDDIWTYSIPAASAEFHQKYPGLAIQYKLFIDTLQYSLLLVCETGNVNRKIGSGGPTKCTNENTEIVRNVTNTHTIFLRTTSQQANLSYGTTHCIVRKKLQMHPYRLSAVGLGRQYINHQFRFWRSIVSLIELYQVTKHAYMGGMQKTHIISGKLRFRHKK